MQLAIDNQRDPLLVVSEFADNKFLAWDDDSGGGFSSAFEYTIPADGDYHLIVLSSPFTQSFGEFRLVAGRNSPDALTGKAVNMGDPFVVATSRTETKNAAVQEISAVVSEATREQRHRLISFEANDTLYVRVETIEGNLIPSWSCALTGPNLSAVPMSLVIKLGLHSSTHFQPKRLNI